MNRDRMLDWMIDIELMDSNALWTALAEFAADAYGRRGYVNKEGDLIQVALTN
jgi:hypothetical protein